MTSFSDVSGKDERCFSQSRHRGPQCDGCAAKRLHGGPARAGLVASAQRHDPVADPGRLSDPQTVLCSGLRQNRIDHPDVPGRRGAVSARHRSLHGPPPAALLGGRGHDLHAGRRGQSRFCVELHGHPGLGRTGRDRLVHLSPRSYAIGPIRLRRPTGSRPGHLSGRGTDGRRAWSASGRVHHRASRAGEPRRVRRHDDHRHGAPDVDRAAASSDPRAFQRDRLACTRAWQANASLARRRSCSVW